MVVHVEPMEHWSSEYCHRSQNTSPINDSSDLPLDLSRTSTRFPFVSYRSTTTDESSQTPVDLSIQPNYIDTKSMSIEYLYNEPSVITEPKTEWHYRSIKDLAKNHIPFLSGIGPQRTPVRIKVPEKSDRKMYLGISVVTYDGQHHDSKVIVPAKTKVNSDAISHDNNLSCLQFDECNRTDYFNPITRHVYLEINEDEHKDQLKDVRIYMFNLYQNQTITKEIIEVKQLHLCRLAFWLCFFDNKRFVPVSPPSYSCIIQEQKNNTRPRASQEITNLTNISNSYS